MGRKREIVYGEDIYKGREIYRNLRERRIREVESIVE